MQSLSSFTLKPKYTSASLRDHFQLSQDLHNVYVSEGLSEEGKEDHIFLYIRPHTQGRGEGVLHGGGRGTQGEREGHLGGGLMLTP